MALREIIEALPPLLVSQLSITSPTTALAECRIIGSIDSTYGTVGWLPRMDGQPFCLIEPMATHEADNMEVGRIWTSMQLLLYLLIDHADTAALQQDYNDRALAWIDSARQMIAANRRVLPASQSLYPTAGDVRWTLAATKILERHVMFGIPWFCVELTTEVLVVVSVNYQG